MDCRISVGRESKYGFDIVTTGFVMMVVLQTVVWCQISAL